MDVDMYISRRDQYPSPTSPEEWRYGAGANESERAFITPRDANFGVGTWYVTVFGYQPSAYTIFVTFDIPNTPTVQEIVDGQALQGFAAGGTWRYYEYTPSRDGWPYTVYVRVTPTSGDPDLGVRVTDGVYPTVTTVGLPQTATRWGWGAAAGSTAIDEAIIAPNAAGVCNPNATVNVTRGPCSYTIGVYAFGSLTAQWSIVVSTTRTSSELTNGVTVGPYTLNNNAWSYYFYRATEPGYTVAFSLVSIRGNPDIYVSTVFQYPNQTNAQWRSTGTAHDNILIERTNVTVYYVAVHSQNQQGGQGASEYTLTARSYNATDPTSSVLSITRQGLAYPRLAQGQLVPLLVVHSV